jgi:hypothetical protein
MTLPSLEDANSIQVALAEMFRLLATQQIDHKSAALMLYALQTASANLRMTSFEPQPTTVVIDQECVGRRLRLGLRPGPRGKVASMTMWPRERSRRKLWPWKARAKHRMNRC